MASAYSVREQVEVKGHGSRKVLPRLHCFSGVHSVGSGGPSGSGNHHGASGEISCWLCGNWMRSVSNKKGTRCLMMAHGEWKTIQSIKTP